MTYDAAAIADYFDTLGQAEWDRFERTLGDRVSLAMHLYVLDRFTSPGGRVLDIGAGPGRFTEALHRLGCPVVVADLSRVQLELNRLTAAERGFAASVEAWHQLDVCDLSLLPSASFDTVVAFGGPLSYVFEHRDRALAECCRVLRPGGHLLLSVMSLWGTLHRHLRAVLQLPLDANRVVIATGNLTKETDPSSTHFCHMYRSEELRTWLESAGLEIRWLSAASAVSTGHESSLVADNSPEWEALLEFERSACVEPGYLDAGTHLIAVVRRGAA